MNLIRAGLIAGLGLGLNVLCTDAWADEDASGGGSSALARTFRQAPASPGAWAWIEAIWSPP
jgi:hypothetical protein